MQPRWGRLLILAAVVVLCLLFIPKIVDHFSVEEAPVSVAQSNDLPLISDADKVAFDESINSDSAILINVDNGDTRYEKDADKQRRPASLVKMMTVYVAIKNNEDIDSEFKMPKEAFKGLDENMASQSGLKPGEAVTIRDLCYAAILSSGGDAANALALETSGDVESFVKLMNKEAEKMGMDSTSFKNPTGLDAKGQVATCRDWARFLKIALGNTLFNEVFRSKTYMMDATEEHPDGLLFEHTMLDSLESFQRYFDTSGYEIVGGKTGFTNEAGNCLVTMAEKRRAPDFIVVTMHATGEGEQYSRAFNDAVTLYGEAYAQVKEAPPERDGSND